MAQNLDENVETIFRTAMQMVDEASADLMVDSENSDPTEAQNTSRKMQLQKKIIESLSNRFLKHLADIAKKHNARLPIHRLPLEILQSVFAALVNSLQGSLKIVRQLQTCMHVCSEWKHIVTNTTSIWGVIQNISGKELTKKILEASQPSPFSFLFKNYIPAKVLDVVIPQISRCKVISVAVGKDQAKKILDALLKETGAEQLEDLAIDNQGSLDGILMDRPTRLSAPLLRSLRLSTLHCKLIHNFQIISPSLKRLSLEAFLSNHPSPSRLCQFLSPLTTLEEFSFTTKETNEHPYLTDKDALDPETTSPILLPVLKRLKIDTHRAAFASVLLRLVQSPLCNEVHVRTLHPGLDPDLTIPSLYEDTAFIQPFRRSPTHLRISNIPALNQLRITAGQSNGDGPTEDVIMDVCFNRRRSKFVESLLTVSEFSCMTKLQLIGIDAVLLSDRLFLLPSLTDLLIKDGSDVDPILDGLGEAHSSGWLCPTLLNLSIKTGSTFTQPSLVAMLKSRYNARLPSTLYGAVLGPATFKRLNIDYVDPAGVEMLDEAGRGLVMDIVQSAGCLEEGDWW
ncbi:hypothetical protein FRC03_001025 [Tulasnella sp. 419]|nr:hypothetical protein FRC03_001025 [Tulasnella sp. 419]